MRQQMIFTPHRKYDDDNDGKDNNNDDDDIDNDGNDIRLFCVIVSKSVRKKGAH